MTFQRVFSSAPWEKQVGYCRAIRVGSNIFVGGTAPVDDMGSTFAPGQAYEQARRCIEIIEKSLRGLGADLKHVVRTRMFVTDCSLWPEFGRAHREAFGEHPPVATMVQVSRLISDDMLIEIEVDAFVSEGQKRV